MSNLYQQGQPPYPQGGGAAQGNKPYAAPTDPYAAAPGPYEAPAADPYAPQPGHGAPDHGVTAQGSSPAPSPEDRSYQRFKAENRSIGEIAADTLDSATRLVKAEVELAKTEAKQTASRAGKGIGMLAAAGVAGLLALIALTLALWWGLALLLGSRAEPHLGVSGIIVTLIWAAIAAGLALAGKGALEKAKGLPQTTETVSKIPNAVTGNEEKNR